MGKVCIIVAGRAYGVFSSRARLVERLVAAGWRVIVASSFDPTIDKLLALGAEWVEIPFHRGGVHVGREIRAVRKLRSLFRKERPALVHLFGVKPMLLAGLASAASPRTRLVCNVTGLGYAFHTTRLRRWVAELGCRVILARTDAVVFENEDDRRWFVERGIVARERSHVILSAGVDVDQYHPAVGNGASSRDGRPVVLMASRLVWQKGVGEFLEAAAALKERHSGVRFVLAGSLEEDHSDGVPREVIERAVAGGAVEYVGFLSDMATRLRSVDLFVLPSYHEGGPRAVMEASASGVPVVATDVSGCRAMVRDGETGLLVAPRDPAALEEAIDQLLSDPALRVRMGAAGRAHMVAEFRQARVIEQTLRLYALQGLDSGATMAASPSGPPDKEG